MSRQPPRKLNMFKRASTNHQLYESVNHGKPAIAATPKPGQFSGKGVVVAKAAAPSYKPVAARAAAPAAAKNAPEEDRCASRYRGPCQ